MALYKSVYYYYYSLKRWAESPKSTYVICGEAVDGPNALACVSRGSWGPVDILAAATVLAAYSVFRVPV